MPKNDDISKLESKFERLAVRLRKGWIKVHPLTEHEKGIVRETVRAQWNQGQQAKGQGKEKAEAGPEKKNEKTKTREKTQAKEKKKSQDKSRGHSFGHDY